MSISTGDINNSVHKLKTALRSIKYNRELTPTTLIENNPAFFLQIINYMFVEYSIPLYEYLINKDFELFSKNDYRFMETVYKIVVKEFGTKPAITIEKFFSGGYLEMKIIFCLNLIKDIKSTIETNGLAKKLTGLKKIQQAPSSSSAANTFDKENDPSKMNYGLYENRYQTITDQGKQMKDKEHAQNVKVVKNTQQGYQQNPLMPRFDQINNNIDADDEEVDTPQQLPPILAQLAQSKSKSQLQVQQNTQNTMLSHQSSQSSIAQTPTFQANTPQNESLNSLDGMTQNNTPKQQLQSQQFQQFQQSEQFKHSGINQEQAQQLQEQKVQQQGVNKKEGSNGNNVKIAFQMISELNQAVITLTKKFEGFQENVNNCLHNMNAKMILMENDIRICKSHIQDSSSQQQASNSTSISQDHLQESVLSNLDK